jgi:hypothetical protein
LIAGGVASPITESSAMSASGLKALSTICFYCGFLSIVASIAIWFLAKDPDAAHGERFGIFVGLWAPTFFALSDRYERYATSRA